MQVRWLYPRFAAEVVLDAAGLPKEKQPKQRVELNAVEKKNADKLDDVTDMHFLGLLFLLFEVFRWTRNFSLYCQEVNVLAPVGASRGRGRPHRQG